VGHVLSQMTSSLWTNRALSDTKGPVRLTRRRRVPHKVRQASREVSRLLNSGAPWTPDATCFEKFGNSVIAWLVLVEHCGLVWRPATGRATGEPPHVATRGHAQSQSQTCVMTCSGSFGECSPLLDPNKCRKYQAVPIGKFDASDGCTVNHCGTHTICEDHCHPYHKHALHFGNKPTLS
jgi:hypothetical protein